MSVDAAVLLGPISSGKTTVSVCGFWIFCPLLYWMLKVTFDPSWYGVTANGTFTDVPPGIEAMKDWRGEIPKPVPDGIISTLLMAPTRGLVMVRLTLSVLSRAKLSGSQGNHFLDRC